METMLSRKMEERGDSARTEKIEEGGERVSREPQKKKTQVRLDYSPAPTQLALLSPICFTV
jgi:hypothetical protein